ncbi:hypothetical protein J3Q64DRAFT_1702530 [Phycomyces blakesleeanus]|uniref:Uncharacterized protein n=2 Tax=Phycomyces blakesleeanus TaxID=4837 RepID=A0A167LUA7_PHYB8|nr:hypothetical protein PHYBLDRAFT_170505 [Phycomyces blakesleeanus NRRL 1555(-)]OAD71117.1 hypothetical protein PHYBLDRAFT_170505 [Phycomyces blakesleeanus NRRL 1555(-)]|eukprot:XP_018289157.1 hypothetical protein PHYBLDRAFT_170505 [Phycomyces blakesleeanus NRRL 1555(-)]
MAFFCFLLPVMLKIKVAVENESLNIFLCQPRLSELLSDNTETYFLETQVLINASQGSFDYHTLLALSWLSRDHLPYHIFLRLPCLLSIDFCNIEHNLSKRSMQGFLRSRLLVNMMRAEMLYYNILYDGKIDPVQWKFNRFFCELGMSYCVAQLSDQNALYHLFC